MKTHITSLQLRGFKSFNRKTDVVFKQGLNCIIGANGSGKCLKGDSLVHLADGNTVPIGELVEQKLKTNNKQQLDDGFVANGDQTKILTLDLKTFKTVAKPIQAYVKRTSPKNLVKIRTRSGREVVSTEYHPLFVLKDNVVTAVNAENLYEGQRIAVPRYAHVQIKNKYFYELLDLISVKDKLYAPYKEEYATYLKKIRSGTWRAFAKSLNLPYNVLKGILDKQAINFAHLVTILRKAGLSKLQIMDSIPAIKSKTSNKFFKIPWQNSPELARFLGYLLAEGRLPPKSDQIWFVNGTQEIVEDYVSLVKKLFEIKPSINEYKPCAWDVLIYSQPIRRILEKLGMAVGGTLNKDVTSLFLSHSSEEELCNILNGLYCGDGYISPSSIEIVTKSPRLAAAIQTILVRLGITFNSKKITKIATNSGFSGLYTQITIYGVENFETFASKITLVHLEKQKRVNALLGKVPNPNLDVLEINPLIKQVAKDLGIPIKPTKEDFPRLSAYCYNQCLPTKTGVKQLIAQLFEPIGQTESLSKLKAFAESDIFWDEVVSIEKVPGEDWVYDLCVAEDHNFVANNIFVHNSNILDAMCFIFGRMSSKDMRAENFSDLLFRRKTTAASEGEVVITLNNESKIFPVDTKEVELKRKIKKKGQTQYKINGRNATRGQVLELLSAARTFPEGHNIILQGDIARFVDIRPVERRQVIEEIAGIYAYEERKNKALQELAKVDERLKEAQIILSEKAHYMENLESEKKGAEEYAAVQNQLKSAQATELTLRMNNIKSKMEKSASELEAAERNMRNLKLDAEISTKKIAQLKEHVQKLEKEIQKKGGEESLTLQKSVECLHVELEKARTLVAASLNEIRRIRERKSGLEKTQKDIEEKIREKEKEKQAIENDLSALKKQESALKKISGTDDLKELVEKNEKLEKKVSELNAKRSELQSDIKLFENNLQNIREKIKEAKAREEKLGNLKDAKARHKKLIEEINILANKDSKLALEIGESKKEQISTEAALAKAQIKSAAVQDTLLSDASLNQLFRKKIEGVIGIVAELGKVDSEYATALKIAAGNRMRNVVVDSVDTAIKCLQHLKTAKAGIATLIPLDKIRAPADDIPPEILKKPGIIGLAHELISSESRYKNLFRYVFRNSLIVKDVSTAKSMGISKYRMITLDGDLFETSGAITGGFREKGGLGFEDTTAAGLVVKLEADMSKISTEIGSAQKERDALEQSILQLRTEKAELEGKVEFAKLTESGDTDFEAEERKVKSKISEIEAQSEKLDKEINEISGERAAVKAKISDLQFGSQKKEVDDLVTKKMEMESQRSAINATIDNGLLPEKENTLKVIHGLEKENKDFEKQQKEQEKKISELEKDLESKEKEQTTFRGKLQELFAQQNENAQQLRNAETENNSILLKTSQLEQTRNNLAIEKAQHDAESAALAEEFMPFKDVQILENIKSVESVKNKVRELNNKLQTFGNVNMRALEIFDAVKTEYAELSSRVGTLDKEKNDVLSIITEIETKKKETFMKTYDEIATRFADIHSKVADKNHAEVELENAENPFEGGILVRVTDLKGKKASLACLSGGEKVLIALSFIFAIQGHSPAPFYLLDEIDAALDKVNSEKVASLLKDYSRIAQVIIISHNDAIISESDNLFGISMSKTGESSVVSLKI